MLELGELDPVDPNVHDEVCRVGYGSVSCLLQLPPEVRVQERVFGQVLPVRLVGGGVGAPQHSPQDLYDAEVKVDAIWFQDDLPILPNLNETRGFALHAGGDARLVGCEVQP